VLSFVHQGASGASHFLERCRFRYRAQVDDALLERVQLVAAHYRVAGDAALAAAGGHLADDLALKGLLVE
jgi:hypothetical protein